MIGRVSSGQVTAVANKTVVSVLASATRRPRLMEVIIGCSGTPADEAAEFAIRYLTADGTGTAGTVFAGDPGDGAPSCTSKNTYTVEPTYSTGNVAEISMHQRNTVIWRAETKEDLVAQLSGSGGVIGIGIQCIVAPSPSVTFNIALKWEE
jgi:hypothetical protein